MIAAEVLAFAVVAAGLTVSPGADTMVIVRSAARSGRSGAWPTLIGNSLGLFGHGAIAALGLSTVLLQSGELYHGLRLAGACYLLWLGFGSLRRAWSHKAPAAADDDADSGSVAAPRRPAREFFEGMAANLLNPKPALFYLALFPAVFHPGDSVIAVAMLLAGIHFAIKILWFSLVISVVDIARRGSVRRLWRRLLETLGGGVLIALGLRLALANER